MSLSAKRPATLGRCLAVAVALTTGLGLAHAVDTWSPTPDPVLDPGCITVSDGLCLGPGSTIIVQEDAQLPLKATSKDLDTKDDGTTKTLVADKTAVVWKASDGKMSDPRTASAANVTFTAP